MARMKAAMAAVLVMEKEGVTQAFGVPGAAINPLYAAMRDHPAIAHILARMNTPKQPGSGRQTCTSCAAGSFAVPGCTCPSKRMKRPSPRLPVGESPWPP